MITSSLDSAHPILLSDHFIQFYNLVGTSKAKTSIMFLFGVRLYLVHVNSS